MSGSELLLCAEHYKMLSAAWGKIYQFLQLFADHFSYSHWRTVVCGVDFENHCLRPCRHDQLINYLKKFRNVCDNIPEDELLLFCVEPAELCDPCEERDQALNDELRQLRLIVQVRQDVVS